jgi:hypothetical protein
MSTEDPKGPEAPGRDASATDDEDDTEGHWKASNSSDPDFGSKAPGRDASKADDSEGGGDTPSRF